jgi:hypothetical protein
VPKAKSISLKLASVNIWQAFWTPAQQMKAEYPLNEDSRGLSHSLPAGLMKALKMKWDFK